MAGFGERLQRERERRRITLDEIAMATKIGTRALRALEQEEFEKLPGGIFNKGFVRAYARCLGIDEEQAFTDYLAAAGEPEREDPLDIERLKKLEANWQPPHQALTERESGRIPWGTLVLIIVLTAAAIGGWKFYHKRKLGRQSLAIASPAAERTVPPPATPPPPPATPLPQAETAPPQPAPAKPQPATAKPQPAPAKPDSASAVTGRVEPATAVVQEPAPASDVTPASSTAPPFSVRIHTREKCWIDVTADGKHLMSTNLDPDKEVTIPANSKIVLQAGNAGGIDVWVNDKPQPSLGPNGKYAKRTYTAETAPQ